MKTLNLLVMLMPFMLAACSKHASEDVAMGYHFMYVTNAFENQDIMVNIPLSADNGRLWFEH